MEKNRQEKIEKTLDFLSNKDLSMIKGNFLESLTKFLGDLLDVDYVLIGKYSIINPKIAETFAIYNRDKFLPSMIYELIHTPCENVIGSSLCCYSTKVQETFPKDVLLQKMNVDSYIGIPLWNTQREPIGLIAILDNKPLHDIETIAILLQIIAIKAAHELEKMHCENVLEVKNKELLNANHQLQIKYNEIVYIDEKLKKSNKELLEAKNKAEESENLKTAFLQNMSHEIRTPLNAISGFASLIESGNLSNEKIASYAKIIQNSSSQLISIVNDILTISSVETKLEKLNIDKVCINETIIDLLTIFKQQGQNKNISIFARNQLSDRQSEIYTDKTKITQIITNLLSNALKFTDEGFIEFGYTLNKKEVEFFVKDSGIGIKPEFHEKIFERFRQLNISAKKLYRGTGLGLAISKAFVDLLGGRIWVKSDGEHGLFFILLFHMIP